MRAPVGLLPLSLLLLGLVLLSCAGGRDSTARSGTIVATRNDDVAVTAVSIMMMEEAAKIGSIAVTVETITLMKDEDGEAGEIVDDFETTDLAFHADVKLSKMGSGVMVRGELVAVRTSEGDDIAVVGTEKEVGGVNNSVDFTFSLPRPWPSGEYRVDVYLDGLLSASTSFMIKE